MGMGMYCKGRLESDIGSEALAAALNLSSLAAYHVFQPCLLLHPVPRDTSRCHEEIARPLLNSQSIFLQVHPNI
jgi:hypothetical protein